MRHVTAHSEVRRRINAGWPEDAKSVDKYARSNILARNDLGSASNAWSTDMSELSQENPFQLIHQYIYIYVCVYDLVLVCFLTLNVYFTADVCFHCRSFLAIQCQHQGSKEDPAYLKWRAQQDKRNRVKQSKRAQYRLKLKTASRHRSIFWRIAIALLRCQQPRQAHQGIQEIPQRGSRKSHFWTRVWRTLPRHRDRRRGTDEKNHTNSLHHLHSCWFHVESHAFCDTRSR